MNIDTHDKFKAPPPTTSELKLRSILRYKKIPFKHSQIIWYTGCDKYTPDYDMMVAEAFLRSLVNLYGRHIVYSDGDTSYPEACTSLGLKHILHSSFEKSIVERAMEYVKDRTENFDDHYLCAIGLLSLLILSLSIIDFLLTILFTIGIAYVFMSIKVQILY